MTVSLKNILNNQGCRGTIVEGVYKHNRTEDTRAIEDAANKTLIGLITECPFPQKDIGKYIKHFEHFVEQPIGLMQFMQALSQMVITDSKRAGLFGCSEELVNESSHYLYHIAQYLAVELEIGLPTFEEFRDQSETRLAVAQSLVLGLQKKELVKHPHMKKSLELFSEQLSLIAATSQLLTEEMLHLNGLLKKHDPETEQLSPRNFMLKQDRSNAAFILDRLTNFAGTPLQEMLNVKACQEKPTPPLPIMEEETQVPQEAEASEADRPAEVRFWDIRTELTTAAAEKCRAAALEKQPSK